MIISRTARPRARRIPGDTGSTVDNTPEPKANQQQTITRADGTTQTQTFDTQGNLSNQAGAGVLRADFGYDTNGTGNLNSLTTYGPVTATTTWEYDPKTGLLLNKKYDDGTEDNYRYNALGQLAYLFEPGVVGKFGYDAAGQQTSSTYNDTLYRTGPVISTIQQEDDLGRAAVTTYTDNLKTFTEADAYTSLGDLQSETFGSAGNASVGYSYYPVTGFPSTGSPDALQTLTISTPAGQSPQQGYTYEDAGKRLQTITVNGIKITYQYLTNSDQLQSITVGNVTTTFTPDSSDGARLGGMTVTADGQTVYNSTYGYNQLDQRTSDAVTTTAVDDAGNTSTVDASRTYTFDPNQADALTQVKDGDNNVLYGFSYDGVGNFTNNAALGSANSVNEYTSTNLAYNLRHDLTNDGTDTFGYDALNRLISVTPGNPTNGSLSADYGYDGQGRMLWEDVSTWAGSWVLSTTYHFLWNGNELVAKLDANNNLLQQYTWGPGENGTDQVQLLTDYTGGSTPHTYLLSYDASGNVTMLLDPTSGQVVGSYSYAPYGALLSATGPDAGKCPFGFKGYWTDYAVDPSLAWSKPAVSYGANRVVDLGYGFWLQDDPTGISGGLNAHEELGNDPINNIDPDGTTYREITGVAGIRWNDADGRAEMGLQVVVWPSWYNYLIGVSDADRASAVEIQWVPINSLPKEYASVAGLQRLANWDKQPIRDQSAPSILASVAVELAQQQAIQQAMTAGVNAAGPTGLGPTGEGLAAGALLEALTSIVRTARTAATAEELRNTAGTVTVSQELSPASGRWLQADRPTPIPAQIAEKLKGQQFKTFADLRAAIWKTIAADPQLSQSFSEANLANMRAGNAPFAPRQYQTNASDAGMRFNLHHDPSIESGGPVYDLSHLRIVSPRVHADLHQ